MKKFMFLCLISSLLCGSIFAQSTPPATVPTTTIKGTLGLSNGMISVVSGNITYYVRGLARFIGFIDGLKEGAQVSLEGYAAAPRTEGQKNSLFHPITLTLNGKNYEVGSKFDDNMTRRRIEQSRRPEQNRKYDKNRKNNCFQGRRR